MTTPILSVNSLPRFSSPANPFPVLNRHFGTRLASWVIAFAAIAALDLALPCVHAQDSTQPPTTQPASPRDQDSAAPLQPSFRSATPEINTFATTPVDPPGGIGTVGESQKEMQDLAEQKDTLDSELLYAKSKLDAARKRLDIESMVGHADAATKWQEEVNDWDARVKSLQGQLSQLNSEVQGVIQQMAPPPPEDTLILPGDNVEIFVTEDTSFNGHYQVRRGGYIILPAVGRIPIAGTTKSGAESAVAQALEATQLQHATVIVEKLEGNDVETGPVIFLSGEFRRPGQYHIPTGTKATVVNVILSCGGVTQNADLTRVRVMREVANKNVTEDVNVQRILDGNGLSSDLTLNDGDILVVPSGAQNVVFLTGSVARTGTQNIQPGSNLTCYTAILNSGGFGRFADLKKVYILRESPDGTKVRIPVNILAIQRGREPDPPLQGGDIIIVPEKFFSW